MASCRSSSYIITGHGLSDLSCGIPTQLTVSMGAHRLQTSGALRSAYVTREGPPTREALVGTPTRVMRRQMPREIIRRKSQLEVQLVELGARSAHVPRRSARLRRSAVPGGESATEGSSSDPIVEAADDVAESSDQDAEAMEEDEEKQPDAPKDQGQEVEVLRVRAMVFLRHRPIPQTGAREATGVAVPSLLRTTVW